MDKAIEGSLVMRVVRSFSAKLKEEVVGRVKAGESVRAVSAETGVLRSSLYQWLEADRAMGPVGLNRKRGRPRKGQRSPFGPMALRRTLRRREPE